MHFSLPSIPAGQSVMLTGPSRRIQVASLRTVLLWSKTKKPSSHCDLRAFYGSGGRDRTYDQLINSQLLYR